MSDETRTDPFDVIREAVKAVERGELSREGALQAIAALAALPVATAGPEPTDALDLATRVVRRLAIRAADDHAWGGKKHIAGRSDRCTDPFCSQASSFGVELTALRGAAAQADAGEAGEVDEGRTVTDIFGASHVHRVFRHTHSGTTHEHRVAARLADQP